MAASVAHEVNNPITGIINFAQVLLDNYKLDPAGITIVEKIIKEGDRIASIIHNFRPPDLGRIRYDTNS